MGGNAGEASGSLGFWHWRSLGCRATGTVTAVTCAITQTAPGWGGFAKQTVRSARRPTRHLHPASAKLPTAGTGRSQPRRARAAAPPLLAGAAVSPALPQSRAEDARRASAGRGGTHPRSQLTLKLLPSRAQPPSPRNPARRRKAPGRHLQTICRAALASPSAAPTAGGSRREGPSGTRHPHPPPAPEALPASPEVSQLRRRKKLISGDKAAAIAKTGCDGVLPEQLLPQISHRVRNPSQTASKPAGQGFRAALDLTVHPLPFLGCTAPGSSCAGGVGNEPDTSSL